MNILLAIGGFFVSGEGIVSIAGFVSRSICYLRLIPRLRCALVRELCRKTEPFFAISVLKLNCLQCADLHQDLLRDHLHDLRFERADSTSSDAQKSVTELVAKLYPLNPRFISILHAGLFVPLLPATESHNPSHRTITCEVSLVDNSEAVSSEPYTSPSFSEYLPICMYLNCFVCLISCLHQQAPVATTLKRPRQPSVNAAYLHGL